MNPHRVIGGDFVYIDKQDVPHYNNIEVDTRLGRTPRGNSSRNSAFKQTWFLQQGHGGYSLHLLDQVCFSFPSFANSSTGCYQGLISNNKSAPRLRSGFCIDMAMQNKYNKNEEARRL